MTKRMEASHMMTEP